jgi:chaperonin GroES
MNLQPPGDRLIVEVLDEEELTVSGIVLPDTAREKPQRGRVLAVGRGPRDEDGNYIEMDVAEGDEIIFSKYGGTEIKLGTSYACARRSWYRRRRTLNSTAHKGRRVTSGPALLWRWILITMLGSTMRLTPSPCASH